MIMRIRFITSLFPVFVLMPKKNTVEKNNKPVFGLFLDDGAYYSQSSLVNGVAEYLMNHGANLMTIPGNLNRHPGDEIFYSVNKMIPHLGPEDINGLIIATLKSRSVSLKQFHAQFGKYLPHPVVTIGYNVNSVPGILYNNESGVMELMRHLVETHRFRHFGFVRGPVDNYDSESRYKNLSRLHRHVWFAHGSAPGRIDKRNAGIRQTSGF
jgi:DNA-binding LacI/PurR family transcriptional regulator